MCALVQKIKGIILMIFTYQIKGMHCASCIEKIRKGLTRYKIKSITLNPPQLKIEDNKKPSLNELNIAISDAGDYQLLPIKNDLKKPVAMKVGSQNTLQTYYPLLLIILYIFGVSSINNIHLQTINWFGWMNQFMAGFFLVFSAFKLLDIYGFAEGYATYDLLARRWYGYGYIYPFLELSLGILYLKELLPITTQILTIVIMGFSSLGVINSLLKNQKIKCACLGTIINVPLSSITLIEDLTMVILAGLTLIMKGMQ